MKDLKIFIPTRGRTELQRTLENLPLELRRKTTLVVDAAEYGAYLRQGYKQSELAKLPANMRGIANIRQWIMDSCPTRYLVMLDDDLKFQRRVGQAPPFKIPDSDDKHVVKLFGDLYNALKEGAAHAGCTVRSLNWQNPAPTMSCTRMMHVLAYDVKQVQKVKGDFTKGVDGKTFSMDDFHMTLQLLRAGLANVVMLRYPVSPSASNSKGGASLWRTLQSHNASAAALQKNHPDFVTVKKKQNWHGMDGDRYDVIVQWQKAFKSGVKQ